MSKKTLVLGASPNPNRYAHKAVFALKHKGHEVVPVGLRDGIISGIEIQKGKPDVEDIDTVTLYVGAQHQPPYYDYLLDLKPKRIIFNPGTKNQELVDLAEQNNIETIDACTLVMLSVGSY